MKYKLILVASVLATSVACIAVVDSVDRHNKQSTEPDQEPIAAVARPMHATAASAPAGPVARLLTSCTGRALSVDAPAGNYAGNPAADTSGMACCAEENAKPEVAEKSGCCAEETAQ